VLDEAVPPELYSWPNRKVLVLVFGALGIILSVLWVFGQEYFSRLQKMPEERRRVFAILSEFEKDWKVLRSKIRR